MNDHNSDPYSDVPPPLATDGPQEPVDWRDLEEDSHPEGDDDTEA
jgi:hypothetical protein